MEHLKQLRIAGRMTQQELGKKIGVTQTAISKYELGKALLPLSTLIELADYFETSIDYLLDRTYLSPKEQEIIMAFRMLSVIEGEKALGIIIGLSEE